jgi:RND superfamily putative drug exporter
VMASLLVPGITAMLGHRAWWPGHGGDARVKPQEPEYEYAGR